ncbi:MAG TPA: gliding motility-associated C-terminal domain-containing protein [Chitinophagaceae bacterium]
MRFVLKYSVVLLFLLASKGLFAQQQEANIWYFGRFLGMDFNGGAPVPLNDGLLNTTEGVATISDPNGNLLFYTDGITIRNRLHQVMPNGTGLFGNVSSTQSGVIVPWINDPTRYYVFTVDAQSGPNGLRYSVVNMTLAGGNGDVELKNVPLQSPVVEKVTAVKHCNNRDIWVLTHGSASDAYYAFLVTTAGVNATPVISNTGSVLPGVVPPSSTDSSSLGYLKASPDGKKIAAAHWTVNVDVSDFNNATGVVSNSYGLFSATDPYYLSYGVEFSPDSRLVYTTVFYTDPANAQRRNALFQYDATLGSAAAVIASKQVISQNSDPIQTYAALQVAPDGKMYMAKNTYKHIASISNPNVYGPGCVFTTNAIQWTLASQSSSFGLPTFIQSYFYPLDSFTYVVNCPGSTVNFNYTPPAGVSSVLWNFGDPASGANNSSVQNNPVHIFSAPGVYNVELIKFTNCGPDTLRKQVSTSGISINLGPDTLVCGGSSVLLNSTAAGSTNTFLWQDGSTNPTFLATTAGLYWVQASNSMGCTSRDSINVTFKPIPFYSLGADTAICQNDTITLNATVTSATSYLWSNGATTSSINAYQAGIYWCDVNKEGCIFRDSLAITAVIPRPVVNLGNDISVCGITPILLDATNPNCTYLWQNGSTNPTLSATVSGLYWVQVRNNTGCITRDSINIAFNSIPVFNLGADTAICQGDSLTLNATVGSAINYLWSNGATTPTIRVGQAGLYWCEVNNGCIFRDSLTVTAVVPRPIVSLGNDISVCGNTPILLDATNPNCTYVWQDGSTNPAFTAIVSGLYWVQVRNNTGCITRDSINIAFNSIPVFNLGADTAICQGDSLTLNATVSSAIGYLWSNGATTPTIRVGQAGLYWCEVNNGCIFRDSLTVTAVVPRPIVNLGNDISVCGNNPILLNATNTNSTYLWQDGSTNPTFTATVSGLYWVQVRNSSGCITRDSINIAFNSIPVFNLGADTPICQGDSLTLNATVGSAISYLWSSGATTATIRVGQAGLYWCEVNNGCIFRDTLVVTAVVPKPVVNLGNDITTCGNGPIVLDATSPNVTYLWQDGSINPTFSATISGLYWVQVRNSSGCTTRDSISITLNPFPVFNLGPDTDICQNDTLTLNATVSNATGFLWNNGATTSTIKAYQAGIYWCEVTRQGCVFRDSLIITSVKPLPVVNLGNDATVCEGITMTLDATYLNSSYLWQDGSNNPVYQVSQQGTYFVQVNYNGCRKSDTITVNYNPKPKFTLGPDQAICPQTNIVLSPVLDPTWQLSWQDGSTAPTYTITQTGTYSLTATNNCGSTADDMSVVNGVCKVHVPNAFTPNNDGLNDLFKALGTETVTQFNLKVFNRWGEVVFQTSDKTRGWDGKLSGVALPSAVFIYVLQYTDMNSPQPQTLKGTFVLIR